MSLLGSSGRMSPETERKLARMLIDRAAQLEDRVQQDGVTAFCGRAMQRERPNERFLQGTLRGVTSHNKRAQEKAMWAAWEKAQRTGSDRSRSQSRQGRRSRSCSRSRSRSPGASHSSGGGGADEHVQAAAGKRRSRSRSRSRDRRECSRKRRHRDCATEHGMEGSDGGGSSSDTGGRGSGGSDSDASWHSPGRQPAATASAARPGGAPPPDSAGDRGASPPPGMSEEALLRFLGSSTRVRGRGELGPKADDPGPYLAGGEGGEGTPRLLGPDMPSWLAAKQAAGPVYRMVPAHGFLAALAGSLGDGRAGRAAAGGGGTVDDADACASRRKGGGGTSSSSKKRRREKKDKKDKQHKQRKGTKKDRKRRARSRS